MIVQCNTAVEALPGHMSSHSSVCLCNRIELEQVAQSESSQSNSIKRNIQAIAEEHIGWLENPVDFGILAK